MSIEIKFISFESQNVSHLGVCHSKSECLRLLGEDQPRQSGIYEYIVHRHSLTAYASHTDKVAIEKTLDRIFR